MTSTIMDRNKSILHDIEDFESKMTEQINNAISDITQEVQENFQKMLASFRGKGVALDEYMRTTLSKMKTVVESGAMGPLLSKESIALGEKAHKEEARKETLKESKLHLRSKKLEQNKSDKTGKEEEKDANQPSRIVSEILKEVISSVTTKPSHGNTRTKKRQLIKEDSSKDELKKESDINNNSISNDDNASKRRKRTRNTSVVDDTSLVYTTKDNPPSSDPDSETSESSDQNKAKKGSKAKSSPIKVTHFKNGDIVWAFWNHKWYAAKICDVEDVPVAHKTKLDQIYKKGNPTDYVVVQFFIDGAFSKVNKSKLETFGVASVDEPRSKGDTKSYEIALEAFKQKSSINKEEEKISKKSSSTSLGSSKKNKTEESSEKKDKAAKTKKTEPKSDTSSKAPDTTKKSIRSKKDSTKTDLKEESNEKEKSKEGPNTYISGPNIQQNDLVIATVRGRKPWPAKVDEILENGDCKVTFFATRNVNYSGGKVFPTKVVKYSRATKEILYKQKSEKMKQAIEEISAEFSKQ